MMSSDELRYVGGGKAELRKGSRVQKSKTKIHDGRKSHIPKTNIKTKVTYETRPVVASILYLSAWVIKNNRTAIVR